VLGPNVIIVELSGFVVGEVDDALGARRQLHILPQPAVATRHLTLDLRPNPAEAYAKSIEDSRRNTIVFADKPEEQVLSRDVVLAKPAGLFLGEENHPSGPLGKSLPHEFDCPPLRVLVLDRVRPSVLVAQLTCTPMPFRYCYPFGMEGRCPTI
jgi:hypothetical protein